MGKFSYITRRKRGINLYIVKFILRQDTSMYEQTNLVNWEGTIKKAIEEFNQKDSRLMDKAVMILKEVREKDFSVEVQIDDRFNPDNRAFFNRIGSLSRYLKEYGMEELLSPHGKLFSLQVTKNDMEPEESNTTHSNQNKIVIDYTNKFIMIPKKMIDEFSIKFYE